ncbi:MAG: hypothetical protein Q8Q54_18265 [Methylococcales bacterium]|nr:hypothetical protein [Methylococcales bacterium]
MKGEIKREVAHYGGLFTSPLILDESHESQWFDFYFLGLDKFTLWNATIITSMVALQDAAHDLAYKQTVEMMTAEELAAECKMEFVPADPSSTGKVLTYRMVEQEKKRYDQFGGLTFSEQLGQLEAKIINEEPPAIYEYFQTDLSYRYGIGLHIVIDAEVINRTVIEQTIIKFRELGEQNWQAEYSVSKERITIK